MNDDISIRYGEDLTLPVSTTDTNAASATLYVGMPGYSPLITIETPLVDGEGVFNLTSDDTSIPLNSYKFQVNVIDNDGQILKYPEPENCYDCDNSFPNFVVCEALDVNEVS